MGGDVNGCWSLASNRELNTARAMVGAWLQGELAQRLDLPVSEIDRIMCVLPTNYALLMDTAEGVNIVAEAVAVLVGKAGAVPFYTRLQ